MFYFVSCIWLKYDNAEQGLVKITDRWQIQKVLGKNKIDNCIDMLRNSGPSGAPQVVSFKQPCVVVTNNCEVWWQKAGAKRNKANQTKFNILFMQHQLVQHKMPWKFSNAKG